MIFSKVIGLTQPKMGFGLLAAFAVRDGYSPSYYKRTHAKKLAKLGRVSGAQGKPGLRCTEAFLVNVMDIARGWDATETEAFMVDHRGVIINESWEAKPDFVRFVVMGGYCYAYSCQLSGLEHFIDGATMMALGGSKWTSTKK